MTAYYNEIDPYVAFNVEAATAFIKAYMMGASNV